jgi:hypothetical protein
MGETAVALFRVLAITTVCGFLVFSKRARNALQKPAWRMYKLNNENRQIWDAIYLAGVLVLALVFTILLVFMFVLAMQGNS